MPHFVTPPHFAYADSARGVFNSMETSPNIDPLNLDHEKEEGQVQSKVDPHSFGINCGSMSFGQLSGYIVFCTVPIVPIPRAKPPL